MADVHSKETRSYNMSRIKGKNTKPEMLVRKFLHAHGYRYRLHDKKLPGKPDIVLPKYKTVIFVHGCFWHGHGCPRGHRTPETRRLYWEEKIARNRNRDARQLRELQNLGYEVLIIWECELRTDLESTTERILCFLRA